MGAGRTAPDEHELLARSLRRDSDAFGQLVERYASSIVSLAYRMVGERADAEDVAQETFLAAFKALPTFRADAGFSTWLYRIAMNKCKDWLRARRARQDSIEEEAQEAWAELAVDRVTPERALTQKQVADHLERAIQKLPPLYREAFVLKHVEGLDYEEMEQIVGVNRDTLKMRVYKARTRLCRALGALQGTG
ncbi:MAG: sigma-70 family RNA polymerase sigma factor [Nitrospirota bacterium]